MADFVRTSWKRVSSASGASKRRTTTSSAKPGRRGSVSASMLCDSQRTNICSHTGTTEASSSAGAGEQRHLAGERLARGAGDLDRDDLPGRGEAVEVDDLVVPG